MVSNKLQAQPGGLHFNVRKDANFYFYGQNTELCRSCVGVGSKKVKNQGWEGGKIFYLFCNGNNKFRVTNLRLFVNTI